MEETTTKHGRVLEYYKYSVYGAVTVLPVQDKGNGSNSGVDSGGPSPHNGCWNGLDDRPLELANNYSLMTARRAGTGGYVNGGASYGRVSQFGNHTTFTGRDWDAATGLMYYRYRMYEPMTGRFVSRDPIARPAWTLAQYAYNAPATNYDPSGLLVQTEDGPIAMDEATWEHFFGEPHLIWACKPACQDLMQEINRAIAGVHGSIGATQEIFQNTVRYLRKKYWDNCRDCGGPDDDDDEWQGIDAHGEPVEPDEGPDGSSSPTDPSSILSGAATIALGTSAADGPLPVGEVVGGIVIVGGSILFAYVWVQNELAASKARQMARSIHKKCSDFSSSRCNVPGGPPTRICEICKDICVQRNGEWPSGITGNHTGQSWPCSAPGK